MHKEGRLIILREQKANDGFSKMEVFLYYACTYIQIYRYFYTIFVH